MVHCTNCGTALQPQWRFCANCAAPTAAAVITAPFPQMPAAATVPPVRQTTTPTSPQPQRPRQHSRLWPAAAALTLMAGAGTLAALFPAYYRNGESLAHTAENLWFNLPAVAGWFIAAGVLAWPRTRLAGAGLVLGVTLASLGSYLSGIGAVVTGTQHAAAGFVLGIAGIAVALVASGLAVAAAIAAGGRVTAHAAAPLWAMLAGAVGIVWAIGDAMDWEQTTVHATTADYTFRATGTATVTQSCCTLLDNHGWALAGQIILVAVAVLIPVVAAAWAPVSFGVAALVGAALALVAGPPRQSLAWRSR